MEGGSRLLEWVTYGVMGLVLLALGVLFVRSAWFFLSLLVIPLAETVGRWRPFRGMVDRWGERGGRRDPELWAARLDVEPAHQAPPRPTMPRAIRLGTRLGAAVGAVPGLWLAVRDASRAMDAGTPGDAVWAVVMGLALVGGAGVLLGAALGAAIGLLVEVARGRSRP